MKTTTVLFKILFTCWTNSRKWCSLEFMKQGKELDWTLPGLSERGLYPIDPRSRLWYLDKGSAQPALINTRRQLPLMSAFAMTSHAAQGQFFSHGAIVDLIKLAKTVVQCQVTSP